ncbi:MAG: hypothetical protein Q8S13_13920 [Dehalococcoidia bacterium]|nr:hypothetical protein [Dehalococcoidia bacterium]
MFDLFGLGSGASPVGQSLVDNATPIEWGGRRWHPLMRVPSVLGGFLAAEIADGNEGTLYGAAVVLVHHQPTKLEELDGIEDATRRSLISRLGAWTLDGNPWKKITDADGHPVDCPAVRLAFPRIHRDGVVEPPFLSRFCAAHLALIEARYRKEGWVLGTWPPERAT